MHWRFGNAVLVVTLIGCGGEDQPLPPTSPRTLQGIDPGIPGAVTNCLAATCLCADFPSAYEVSQYTFHPVNYSGDGEHVVTVQGAGAELIHVWPATACGDSMAAQAMTDGCPVCIDFRRETEPEMLNRTYSIWPGVDTWQIFLRLRDGLAYYAHQDGYDPVRIDAAATFVRID